MRWCRHLENQVTAAVGGETMSAVEGAVDEVDPGHIDLLVAHDVDLVTADHRRIPAWRSG